MTLFQMVVEQGRRIARMFHRERKRTENVYALGDALRRYDAYLRGELTYDELHAAARSDRGDGEGA